MFPDIGISKTPVPDFEKKQSRLLEFTPSRQQQQGYLSLNSRYNMLKVSFKFISLQTLNLKAFI
jgi:hypothetical protein